MTITKTVFDGEIHTNDSGERVGRTVELTPDELVLWEKREKESADEQAELAKTQYQRDRKEEYPTIEECVHAILDGELDALQVKRQAVKDKYPKGAN